MNDTQFQIDHLIELAVLQRAELKQLVDSMPQLRDHLSEEIERNLEEAEPAIRSELEQLVIARATDEHAKISVALTAKIDELAKALEITTAAKYSVLMAERAENANLLAKAEARIEDAASMLTHAVKEIVTDELSRFPRAGEIDQLRKEFAEPRGLNPRGRWMPDETYQRLDLVTVNGDSFVSNIDGNRERPSRTAGDWTLSAARGNGGGGGVTSLTDLVSVPSNGQLLIGNGSGFVNSTLTAGTGISISNGAGSITINATDGNITLDDGTAAAPSLNFTNEPTTGLFRASANVMGFAVNGVSRATMTTTGVTVAGTITPTGSVHAAAGSLGNPSIAFNADQNTGLYRIGTNNIGVAANGNKVLDIATTGLTVTGALGASSLTSPAGNNLTLAAGGTNQSVILMPSGTGGVGIGTTTPGATLTLATLDTLLKPALGLRQANALGYGYDFDTETALVGRLDLYRVSNNVRTQMMSWRQDTGDVTISSTTAGSSGAGALFLQGGLSAAGASYIGGTITAVGTGTHTFGTTNTVTMAAGAMTLQGATAVTSGRLKLQSSNTDYGNGVTLLYSSVSPDASARAWQIASNFIANGNLDFLVSASNSTQATGAAISFTSAGGINAAGAVTAASLATAQTAAVATSIVITHKIPITLNGTVYYMALTATP